MLVHNQQVAQDTSISEDSTLRIPDHVLSRCVGEETVLLSLEDEHYYGLEGVGTRLWEIVQGQPTFREVIDALLAEYEVEREVLVKDVTAVVWNLQASGLLAVDAA